MKIKLLCLFALLSILNLQAMEEHPGPGVPKPEGFYFNGLVNGLAHHHRISKLMLARNTARLEFQKNFPYFKWVYDAHAIDNDFSVLAIANPKSENDSNVWLRMLPVTDEGRWPEIKIACLRLDNLFKAAPEAYIMLTYINEQNGKKLFQSRVEACQNSNFTSLPVSTLEANGYKDKKIMALLKIVLKEKELEGQIALDTRLSSVDQNDDI